MYFFHFLVDLRTSFEPTIAMVNYNKRKQLHLFTFAKRFSPAHSTVDGRRCRGRGTRNFVNLCYEPFDS